MRFLYIIVSLGVYYRSYSAGHKLKVSATKKRYFQLEMVLD